MDSNILFIWVVICIPWKSTCWQLDACWHEAKFDTSNLESSTVVVKSEWNTLVPLPICLPNGVNSSTSFCGVAPAATVKCLWSIAMINKLSVQVQTSPIFVAADVPFLPFPTRIILKYVEEGGHHATHLVPVESNSISMPPPFAALKSVKVSGWFVDSYRQAARVSDW